MNLSAFKHQMVSAVAQFMAAIAAVAGRILKTFLIL